MEDDAWCGMHPPHDLGVIAHGPAVLSRAPDIAAGLRAVFAYPGGLHLLLTYRAVGDRAHAARSWSYGRVRRYPGPTEANPYSVPRVHVTLDGRTRPADTAGPVRNSDAHVFSVDASYWIGELPRDGQVSITVEWPHAGLPRTETTLTLNGLDDLDERVLPLLQRDART